MTENINPKIQKTKEPFCFHLALSPGSFNRLLFGVSLEYLKSLPIFMKNNEG